MSWATGRTPTRARGGGSGCRELRFCKRVRARARVRVVVVVVVVVGCGCVFGVGGIAEHDGGVEGGAGRGHVPGAEREWHGRGVDDEEEK